MAGQEVGLSQTWKALYNVVVKKYIAHLETAHNGEAGERGECVTCDLFNDVLRAGKEKAWKK